MSNAHAASLPDVSVWQTEVLRLTAFPSPGASIGEVTWWAETVGQLPESKVLQPKRGVQKEKGPFQGGELNLSVRFNRIDWLLTAIEEPDVPTEGFSTVGAFTDSLDAFRELMLRWLGLETSPPLLRLALGAVLLQPAESHEAGYRRIAAYLPTVELDHESSQDFLYRINRPRVSLSGIRDLRVNRLSTWSVIVLRSAKFAMGPKLPKLVPGAESYAARLELDVNTAVDFERELPKTHMPRLLQELSSLCYEIAQQGDVP